MPSVDRASALLTLRASPMRFGIWIAVGAGLLWEGIGLLLAALDRQGVWAPSVWFALLVGFAVLAGLLIPGWPGWRGYSTGGVVLAILAGIAAAILKPDDQYSHNAFAVLAIAFIAVAWAIVAGAGFAIAAAIRRLRRNSGPTDPSSGGMGAR